MIGNEAEKHPGRVAPHCHPILKIAGGIAHQLGRDRALLITFSDNADEVPGSCDLRGGISFMNTVVYKQSNVPLRFFRRIIVLPIYHFFHRAVIAFDLALVIFDEVTGEVRRLSRRSSGGTRVENRRACPAERVGTRAGFHFPGNAGGQV